MMKKRERERAWPREERGERAAPPWVTVRSSPAWLV